MSNLRLKDHTWDAANVYDSALGKTQEQINAEVGTSLAGKQGTLVSGENIKTVNGASILGSGNIEIPGGGGSSVVVDDTLSIAGAAADAKKTGDEIGSIKAALTVEKYGVPTEFANVFINNTGAEAESAKVLTGNRYYNYLQDGLVSIEAPEPYAIWGYAWIRAVMKGSIKTDGSISYTGTTANLHKLNLSEYPEYLFRFALVKIENGDRVDIDPSEAVNVKFTFKTNNALSNRRFSVMGDSISSFDGYTTPGSPNAYYPSTLAKVYHLENMYWKYLADRNGMSVEVIDAYGGSTVADKWQDTVRVPFYDDSRVNSLGEPDIIIIQGGINDFGGNPLGEYPAIGDYSKTYEFRTAYSLLLNKLKTKYKQATIVCLSMITPRSYNNTTFPEKQTEVIQALATDTTPHTFAEFNESIEKIAKQYQCAYCDITDLLNYYVNPTSSLGPHWFFNLHMDVAYRIEQKLKEIYA